MKKSNVNKEAEAIEFLKSIGYRFDANEKQFFPGKEEIAETYPLDFLKERLAYNDMLLQEPFNKDIIAKGKSKIKTLIIIYLNE